MNKFDDFWSFVSSIIDFLSVKSIQRKYFIGAFICVTFQRTVRIYPWSNHSHILTNIVFCGHKYIHIRSSITYKYIVKFKVNYAESHYLVDKSIFWWQFLDLKYFTPLCILGLVLNYYVTSLLCSQTTNFFIFNNNFIILHMKHKYNIIYWMIFRNRTYH